MLGKGKKTKQWEATRRKLKVRFEAAGIPCRCEICGSTFALSFAHRLKRRDITTQEELETCALLCIEHHGALEYGSKQIMFDRITAIIAARKTPV